VRLASTCTTPIGVVHGGFAMTILDSAMGCAVHTTLAAGEAYTSLETSVNFVRPITSETGPVRCEGKILHAAEGSRPRRPPDRPKDRQAPGTCTTTCLVMRP